MALRMRNCVDNSRMERRRGRAQPAARSPSAAPAVRIPAKPITESGAKHLRHAAPESGRVAEILALQLQVSDAADVAPNGPVREVRGDGDDFRQRLDGDGRLDVRPVAAVSGQEEPPAPLTR